jgi:hypothetical protein
MRRLWIGTQVVLAAAVLYFVGRSMARNWDAIRQSGAAITLDPAALVAAAGIILATYAMLISAWRAVLLGWGERLAYPQAARIWTLSNLARYVPGRIWQIAGMAAMAREAGVSPWAAAGSAVVVQLLAIATGALVTGITAPQAGQPALIAAAGLAAALVAAGLAWPPATRRLARLLTALTRREFRLEPVAAGPLLLSTAVTTLAWGGYGLALYFFVQGVLGEPRIGVVAAVGAFTASYLVGLLLVFTPGGLGVREGAIYALLAGPLGPAAAFVVMIGSRLLMTATEVLAALVTLPLTGPRTHGTQA